MPEPDGKPDDTVEFDPVTEDPDWEAPVLPLHWARFQEPPPPGRL